MPSTRHLAVSVGVGLLHAAVLLAVALRLGYSVGPSSYAVVGLLWRYGGLVAVAALPTFLALRYGLLSPLVALAVTSGYVLGMELTPPGPTFHDVADLERLGEPTGIVVVEDGLYVVRYMVNASVWLLGFGLLGLLEHAVRTEVTRLPVAAAPSWLSVPADRRRALTLASGAGVCHALAMVWFAARLGVTISGVVDWPLYLFGALGMWVLAALPTYLLVRHRLLAPFAGLVVFVLLDARAEFAAGVEDAHALYFGGWFVFLGVLLAAGGVEYGLRRVDVSLPRFG